jgi:hypothetical protein
MATVEAAVGAAAERIAAAGCEEPRSDAEALVADALGIDPADISRDGSGEVPVVQSTSRSRTSSAARGFAGSRWRSIRGC